MKNVVHVQMVTGLLVQDLNLQVIVQVTFIPSINPTKISSNLA